MTSPRERFLHQVRQAVTEGNRAGHVPALDARGNVGYQGAGPDPAVRFRDEFLAAGGQSHFVPDRAAAVGVVGQLIKDLAAQRILIGRGAFFNTLDLAESIRMPGVEFMSVNDATVESRRKEWFAADVGVSGVDYLIAETGSIVVLSGPDQSRSISLLPPVHIAIAWREQILPDLFDLFEARLWAERQGLPSCLSLITGPSKTGDIELRLVTGVHGPGEVHVILIEQSLSEG